VYRALELTRYPDSASRYLTVGGKRTFTREQNRSFKTAFLKLWIATPNGVAKRNVGVAKI